MEKGAAFHLYRDIAERTEGDVYIGVVGPVRTGKSTFIARFMEELVLPHSGIVCWMNCPKAARARPS